jgi:large subunit ribosomal protein L4
VATLAKVSTARRVLVVAERHDELTWKSLRNHTAVHLLEPGQLNTYDVLRSDDIVFTQAALEAFLAGPATGRSAKAVASSTELDAAELEAAAVPITEVEDADVDDAEVEDTDVDDTEVEDADVDEVAVPEAAVDAAEGEQDEEDA